jgi:hypothetical protein
MRVLLTSFAPILSYGDLKDFIDYLDTDNVILGVFCPPPRNNVTHMLI